MELLDDSTVIFPPDDTVERLADHLIANGVTIAEDKDVLTNADRIRAMSNEELALCMAEMFVDTQRVLTDDNRESIKRMSAVRILHWLQQPAEEGDHDSKE